jgi:membrane protease YdiL (CAAX protease family)
MRALFALLERHPILSSIIGVFLVVIVAGNVAFAFVQVLANSLGLDRVVAIAIGDGTGKVASALIFFLVLRYQGWTSAVGFNRPARWKEPWLIWLPALLIGVNFINLIGATITPEPNVMQIAARASWGVPVALFEETTYRGFVLAVILSRYHSTRAQVLGSVLFSSLLFGLMHFPNDPYWETNVSQWVYALLAGVGFCAVVLRTRSIWLVMGVHALIIAANAITAGLVVPRVPTHWDIRLNAILTTAVTIPLFLYGLYLLRDISRLNLPTHYQPRNWPGRSSTASATASG